MSIDSTAELLFKIGAETDDAEGNIARFRTLMSKDLSDLGGEFKSWSEEIIGEITTVQAAVTAGAAVIAAGILATAVVFDEAGKKYAAYADEISRGMKLTGLHAEDMSMLHAAAQKTGVDYDVLVNGLLKFSSSIVKASEGSATQLKAFTALGVSQKDVIAGQQDLLPLLEKVMDGFHGNASAVQKASLARDLFSRSGTELLNFLSKGSAGLKEFGEDAKRLGLILSDQDVKAARELKLAIKELKEEQEAIDVTIGKESLPIMIRWKAAMVAAFEGFRSLDGPYNILQNYLNGVAQSYQETMDKIHKAVFASHTDIAPPPLTSDKEVKKVKEAQENYEGISSILEGLKTKLASFGDEHERLVQEMDHYNFETEKAVENLARLQNEGKITAEAAARESAALKLIPEMLQQIWQDTLDKSEEAAADLSQAQAAALDDLHRTLVEKLSTYDSQSYANQRAKFNKEIDDLTVQSQKKAKLTQSEIDLLAEIRKEGLEKIDAEQTKAYEAELTKLTQHIEKLYDLTLNGAAKLDFTYQKDLEKFSAAEEAKAIKTAQTEAEIAAIHALYAQARSAITTKYQQDLQTLLNSQGWEGVFGSKFGSMLKGNEALMKEWAQSTNQSLLMVKVSMEVLKEMAEQAFESMAQGMGQNIAHAIEYKTSIGEAMRAALASTLESLAAQSISYAIYATALGFLDLALQNYAGAGQAFTAAAIFGTVGVAAAVAGRAIAPPSASSGASSTAAGSSASSGSSAASSAGSSGTQQPTVIVNIAGHVIGPSGAAELADILNQAVYGNDVTLYASHSATGVPL